MAQRTIFSSQWAKTAGGCQVCVAPDPSRRAAPHHRDPVSRWRTRCCSTSTRRIGRSTRRTSPTRSVGTASRRASRRSTSTSSRSAGQDPRQGGGEAEGVLREPGRGSDERRRRPPPRRRAEGDRRVLRRGARRRSRRSTRGSRSSPSSSPRSRCETKTEQLNKENAGGDQAAPLRAKRARTSPRRRCVRCRMSS